MVSVTQSVVVVNRSVRSAQSYGVSKLPFLIISYMSSVVTPKIPIEESLFKNVVTANKDLPKSAIIRHRPRRRYTCPQQVHPVKLRLSRS